MKLRKSLFLNVDGADGTGKSTSLRILRRMLMQAHIPAFYTAEPAFQQSRDSQAIRHILLTQTLSKKLQASLFVVARKLHIQKVIRPKMKQHRIIISSRYVLSNLAYQGNYKKQLNLSRMLTNKHVAHYVDENHIMQMNIHDIKNFTHYLPDVNFYFYMTPKTESERLMGRSWKEDKFDSYLENTKHLAKLQDNYKHGINELARYNSPTIEINADKLNQFQRAQTMFDWIKKQINKLKED